MTMKIDAAEVAKVFTDLKLPAAFKAYEQQLGDPDAMKLDFGDRVALILRAELDSRTQKRGASGVIVGKLLCGNPRIKGVGHSSDAYRVKSKRHLMEGTRG